MLAIQEDSLPFVGIGISEKVKVVIQDVEGNKGKGTIQKGDRELTKRKGFYQKSGKESQGLALTKLNLLEDVL